MEEMHRARYVGRSSEHSFHSGCGTFPAPWFVHQHRCSLIPMGLGFLMRFNYLGTIDQIIDLWWLTQSLASLPLPWGLRVWLKVLNIYHLALPVATRPKEELPHYHTLGHSWQRLIMNNQRRSSHPCHLGYSKHFRSLCLVPGTETRNTITFIISVWQPSRQHCGLCGCGSLVPRWRNLLPAVIREGPGGAWTLATNAWEV